MTIWNQADLYYLNLRKLVKQEGDFPVHVFELEVMNVNISDNAFQSVVVSLFREHTVQTIAGGFLVVGEMNAEEMTDGENDFSDEKKFLEKISSELLESFKALPGWGENGGPDKSTEYKLLD